MSLVLIIVKAGSTARGVVHRSAVISLLVRVLGAILGCILGRLLGLATLHLGLFQKSLLLRQSLALFAVFHLILSNQGFGWMSKDALIFTEFTNPDVLETRGMVKVRVLLLDLALTCR